MTVAESPWQRLHPLSALMRFGAVLPLYGFLFISLQQSGANARAFAPSLVITLIAGTLATTGGFITWLVTRWRIHGGDLQVEMGLLRRQSFRVPLTRIQAVDVVEPLMARLLGLAEVRVVSAGSGLDRCRLAYLRAEEAPLLRARLLALAHGLAAETPEPPAQPMLRVDNVLLAVGLFMRAPVVAPVALGAIGIVVAALVPAASADLLGPAFGSAGLGFLTGLRGLNEDFGFTISRAADGFRLDRGLLQKRHETIPHGRIQAVRVVTPLLWRLFGWDRVEVDVARQRVSRRADRDGQQVARVLIPMTTRQHAEWIVAQVMPGADTHPPAGSGVPRRALVKAPLSYYRLAAWEDGERMYARIGRLQIETVVVPLNKVQSVRMVTGPLLRALRLATVHVDTAGKRWQAAARCRDELQARDLLGQIPDLARAARRGVATSQGSRATPG